MKKVLTVIGSLLIVAGFWGSMQGIRSHSAQAQVVYLVLSVAGLAAGWYLLMRSWDRTIAGDPRTKQVGGARR